MTITMVLQVLIAFGIFNVWILRRNKATMFRGGPARNMYEEFEFYGLPNWSTTLVGASKVALASLLLLGLWVPELTPIGALGLAVFMLGAVIMHIKVRDHLIKHLPAVIMLALCCYVALSSNSLHQSIATN